MKNTSKVSCCAVNRFSDLDIPKSTIKKNKKMPI